MDFELYYVHSHFLFLYIGRKQSSKRNCIQGTVELPGISDSEMVTKKSVNLETLSVCARKHCFRLYSQERCMIWSCGCMNKQRVSHDSPAFPLTILDAQGA